MKTSRSALGHVLYPGNTSVNVQTLEWIAKALGKRLRIDMAEGKEAV